MQRWFELTHNVLFVCTTTIFACYFESFIPSFIVRLSGNITFILVKIDNAVYLHQNNCNSTVLLNLILTIIGYVPGLIHALWVILK
ncbi:unnamed protein product [Rotaria magnacalcarata]